MAITEKKQHWLDIIFRDRVELPGREGVLIPRGATSERPVPPKVENGYMRYNTDLQEFEVYKFGAWTLLSTGAGTVGEVNDGVNVGTGEGIFKDKLGVDLRFKSLLPGSWTPMGPIITVTAAPSGNEIIIDSPAYNLFVAKAGDQMTGDLEMVAAGAQILLDRNGVPADASLGFYGDSATGIYQTNGGGGPPWMGYLSITNNGMPSWNFSAAGDLLPDPLNTGGNIGSAADRVTSVNSNLYQAADGLGPTPSYTFFGFPGTGMWRDASGYLGLSVANNPRWKITTAGHLEPEMVGYNVGNITVPVATVYSRYVAGDPAFSAVLNPTYTWIGDTSTGMYSPGPGTLGFSIANNAALEANADGAWLVPATTKGGNTYEQEVINYGDDVLTNKKYVDDAILAGAAQDYEQTFTDGSPEMGATVADQLDVNHGLNQEWPTVAVWDDNRVLVYPNVISVDANNIRVDFSGGWRPLSGTWHVKVVG